MVTNEFLLWLAGFGFGFIFGWLITWTYFIRKTRILKNQIILLTPIKKPGEKNEN